MPLETGQILNNRYRIVKLLGQGGFGAVYRAWDINLERPRALKENLEISPEAQRQFKREAQILCDLEHPNLPHVVDHFVIPGQGQYLVMDYVEGEDLQEKLNRSGGPLPAEQVVPWILQVCDALEYLHSQTPAVIHRDIKPANIRVTSGTTGPGQSTGRAKLVDFGIAKVYDPALKTTLGARAVTPGFSPPEQYGMGNTDAQSDIYALGATLYCLLTGQEPPASVDMVSGSCEPPPAAHLVNPQVSEAVSAAIEKAMLVRRTTRFSSVLEFRQALTAADISTPVVQRAGTVQTAYPVKKVLQPVVVSKAAAPVSRRFRWEYVLGGAVILSAVAGGLFGISRLLKNQPAEKPPPVTPFSVIEPTTIRPPATDTAISQQAFEPLFVEAPNCEYGGNFKMIHAVDELTVKFIFCQPEPAFLAKIASPVMSIQPAEVLNTPGIAGQLIEGPVGTGPYQVGEWSHGDHIKLRPFEAYWGEKARSEVLLLWESDAENRLSRVVEGSVDAIDNPPSEKFAKIQSDLNLRWVVRPPINILYLGINNRVSPFGDEEVRQAIAMGIDRQWLIDKFLQGESELATHFTPCVVPFGCNSETWYEFNPDLARKLLADAGFPDGFSTVLVLRGVARTYLTNYQDFAEGIKLQLQDNLNIETEIKILESNEFLDQVNSSKIPGLFLLGWTGDYPDVSDFLDPHFGENAPPRFGEQFPDITSVLKSAASSANVEERGKQYTEANLLLRTHVPMVPLAHIGSAVVYHQAVENPQASPFYYDYFRLLYRPGQDAIRFMQSSEPVSMHCARLTDVDSMRACSQVSEPLYRYTPNAAEMEPALAEICEPNEDLSVWHCYLRKGVKFHNGSTLDANDVVMSYAVQWDASSPLHREISGDFPMWEILWGEYINQP